MRRIRNLLSPGVTLLLVACQLQPRPQPPLTVPAAVNISTHFAGNALSGPRTPTTHATAANSDLHVDVCWAALASLPAAPTVALGSKARLIFAGNSRTPLLGSPGLTASIRLVEGDAVRRLATDWAHPASASIAPLHSASTVLPPGVTAEFVSNFTTTQITLQLARNIGGATDVPLQLAITVDDAHRKETVLIDRTATAHVDEIALLIPMHFADSPATALGVSVTVRPPAVDDAHADEIARCEADLKSSAQSLSTRPTQWPTGLSESAGFNAALSGLADENHRRSSLVFLADQTSAYLCQDVSLVADNSVVSTLATDLSTALKAEPLAAQTADGLGWLLNRTAFELLTSFADSPEGGRLPPELAAVLTRFAGEAARHPSSLDEIAHGVGSDADLHNRIVAQNLIFLTDPSPAARVRAFDWLNSRKLAPPGFDPLGGVRERREAISRATSQP